LFLIPGGIAQPLEPVDMEDDFILLSKKKKKRAVPTSEKNKKS